MGEATKEDDICKVGKFGLGFNPVYNMTDVPFILSKKKLLILDPHSKRRKEGYLEKQMKNQHGTRITLKINRKSVEKYQN